MKVYLVEDSQQLREKIRTSVADVGGIIVGEATTESTAVSAISLLRPDLVIVDLQLTEGNGINVIRKLKQSQPDLMLMVLTNCHRAHYADSCLAAGADWFLEKNSEYPQFETLIKRLSRDNT